MATLDLDGDGRPEIAVGTRLPYPEAPGGSVTVAHGPISGVVDLGAEDVRISGNSRELIGAAVAAGDRVGDATPDLAIAVTHLESEYIQTAAWEIFDGSRW